MKFKYTIYLIFFCFSSPLSAQEFGSGHELLELSNASFEYFENTTLDSNIPQRTDSPEQILRYFFFGLDTNVYRQILTDVRDSLLLHYQYTIDQRENPATKKWDELQLNYKLSFTLKDEERVYIGYSLFLEKNIYFGSYLALVKEDGKWKIIGEKKSTQEPRLPHLNPVLIYAKPSKLYHLITGELSDDPLLNQVIKNTRYNNGFDANKFSILKRKWRREKNQKMIEYFFYQ